MILCTLNTFNVPGVTDVLISECAVNWLPVLPKEWCNDISGAQSIQKELEFTNSIVLQTCLGSHCNEMWSNRHSGDNCVILHGIHIYTFKTIVQRRKNQHHISRQHPMFDAATNL